MEERTNVRVLMNALPSVRAALIFYASRFGTTRRTAQFFPAHLTSCIAFFRSPVI
jgi:hypothetical protein